MLYEMLAQQRPFDGKTNADTLVAMLERDAAPLFGTNAPRQPVLHRIEEVVGKALRKEPADRYQTATEMRADLERIKRALESDKSSAVNIQTNVDELGRLVVRPSAPQVRRAIAMMIAAGLLVVMFALAFFYQRHRREVSSSPVTTAPKSYLQMTEREQLIFVETQEQHISAMMGDRPVKLNDEAVRAIKAHVDRYSRHDSLIKPGEESLRDIYARAPEYIPVIAHAFVQRKIPVVVGIYLPMIESAYRPCFENEIGAKGLFQFLPATAAHYGLSRAEMCDVSKNAPAAAHYIADRMAELGDDAQSMTLVLVSYNRGDEAVREALRRLRETDANYERNFWTLFANRDKLDEGFRRESAGYVPEFFAAAIVGENPEVFDLQMPPLSSFAKSVVTKN